MRARIIFGTALKPNEFADDGDARFLELAQLSAQQNQLAMQLKENELVLAVSR